MAGKLTKQQQAFLADMMGTAMGALELHDSISRLVDRYTANNLVTLVNADFNTMELFEHITNTKMVDAMTAFGTLYTAFGSGANSVKNALTLIKP